MKKTIILVLSISLFSSVPAHAGIKEDSKMCNNIIKITNGTVLDTEKDLEKYFLNTGKKLKTQINKTNNKKLSKMISDMSKSFLSANKIMKDLDYDKKQLVADELNKSSEILLNYCFDINVKIGK
jgi:hypothetical protein